MPLKHLIIRLKLALLLVCMSCSQCLAGDFTASDIFSPTGFHVRGNLDWSSATLEQFQHGMAAQSIWQSGYFAEYYQFEAWYFKEACVVTATNYAFSGIGPQTQAYIYWYDKRAPDGDSRFQLWVTEIFHPLPCDSDGLLSNDNRLENPYFHLVQYEKWKSTATKLESKNESTSENNILLRRPSLPVDGANSDVNINYKLHDDRVLSMTEVMQSANSRQTKTEPQSDVAYVLFASDFDSHYPALPKYVEQWCTSGSSLAHIQSIEPIPNEVTPETVLRRITAPLKRVPGQRPGSVQTTDTAELTIKPNN